MPKKHAPNLSDITLPKNYDMKRDGISQSLLSCFPLCRMKFLLKINGWRKPEGDVFVIFGNICHEVLDKVYTRGKFPTKKFINKIINGYCVKIEDTLSRDALDQLNRQADLAALVMWEYFLHYRKDFKKLKFDELERTFTLEYKGFKLRGKKDGIIQGKNRTLFEHKTKVRVKHDVLDSVLNFDFQNQFYIVADKTETGKRCAEVLYNIIRNPGLRHNKNETYTEYLKRVRKDIRSRPDFYFIRKRTPYLKRDISNFESELKYKLEEAYAFTKGKLPLYRNQMACEIPYKCEFLDACGRGNMIGYVQSNDLFPELE